MPAPRVLVAQISHETNTFNPVPTTLDDFSACGLYHGADLVARFRGTDTELGGFIDTLLATGAEPVGGVAASAIPSGPVAGEAFAALVESVLAALDVAPVDGVLLALHGAMVTVDGESCETHLLRQVRRRVGGRVPVVCTLDLHANLEDQLISLATALVPYDTNPHVDLRERGEEAAAMLLAVWQRSISPVSSLARIPLLLSPLNQSTEQGPMAEVLAAARQWEARPGILNVGVLAGFPFSDVPTAGVSVLAIADGDTVLAARAAEAVAGVAWDLRERFIPCLPSPAEALAGRTLRPGAPVVLAEVADNVNAGAPGDGTYLLAELLRTPVHHAVYAAVADWEAVARASAAGVGSTVRLGLGGKVSSLCGPTLAVEAYVKLISDGRYVNVGANNGAGMLKGFPVDMGRTVVLAVRDSERDLEIVVTERRVPPIGPEMFRSLGIDPAEAALLAVKTRGHYWRQYSFVQEIVEVDTPGLACANLASYPYRRLQRPKFPLDTIS